jgi:hypothetical protein
VNAPRPKLPPLRVHHLLAWMTVTAVVISVSLWFDRTARNGPPLENKLVIVALVALAICVSGAICCAGLGLHWRYNGYSFPAEPGQWLLIEIAAAAVVVLLWIAGTFAIFLIDEDFATVFQIMFLIAAAVLFIASNYCIAGWHCDTILWRTVFGYLAAFPFLAFAWGAARLPFADFLTFVGMLLLLSAAANDWLAVRGRNWMHWFGVVFSLVIVFCNFALAQ